MMEVGDRLRLLWKGTVLEGTFIKKDDNFLVLKLDNGYNVGIPEDEVESVEILGKRTVGRPKFHYRAEFGEGLPTVGIAATGGTIAARVDYVTGAVTAEFTVEDLVNSFPEIREMARLELRQVSNILSENMMPELWSEIAKGVYELLKETEGVVVTHGTDTMHYTTAYLSFALKTPKPVVFTGAQRSSDRPSSDAALNLLSSLYVAGHSNLAGVFLCMHEGTSDGWNAVHLGTRVRKMHTSRRDTFRSIGRDPVARVYVEARRGRIVEKRVEVLDPSWERRGKGELSVNPSFNDNVALIKYFPGMRKDVFGRLLTEHDGVIIEGTGFGHVREELIPLIGEAVESGVFVGVTSQTIYGRTHPHVYSTAVKMAEAGAVFLEDMVPEAAYAKLVWVLGQTKDLERAREMMLTNYAGEITQRSGIEWKL